MRLVYGSVRLKPHPFKLGPARLTAPVLNLHPAALRRTAAVVRNRSDVLDQTNFDTSGSQCANRRLTAGSRTADANFDAAQSVVTRLGGGIHRRLLRCEGSAFTRSAEPERAGTLPGKDITFLVGDGHDGVVEGGLNVSHSVRNVLALAALECF